ncbi:alpha/beta fold hydrolase [Hymenobacter latericus]|uniref:alpha/beta fold hydrolase n=1 Tax=Hymenobacter sp. YIM 151858-1 TaxID=2987688 RepID=UPI002226FA64|nr:alpha/beta hydrolase [Hymenobacter sp. YIM 151858-1]UYZ57863.1 alpha/beta hydrolase [Hymenobacter sp. YIM 151858-1]
MTPAELIITETDLGFAAGYTLRVQRLLPASPAAAPRPTLVFLHDSLGCIRLWRDFPARLAAATGCPALVYDRRGYGQSSAFADEARTNRYLEQEAPVLRQVLDACQLEQAILFGHSDGGSIALLAAALHPERVVGVITEGAHVFVEDLTLAGIRAAQQQYRSTNLPERLARYHGSKTDAVFRAWAGTWLAPAFRSWNIESYLPRVQCPLLVLQGEADEYGTAAQVQAIARQAGGPARSVLLPGAAHTPHKEAPTETLQLATDFVRQLCSS